MRGRLAFVGVIGRQNDLTYLAVSDACQQLLKSQLAGTNAIKR